MTKPTDLELMQAYDGELAPDERQRLESAIGEHPESARVLAGLGLVSELVRAWARSREQAGGAIAERVMARIEAEDRGRRRRTGRGRASGFAAMALALAALLALLLRPSSPPRSADGGLTLLSSLVGAADAGPSAPELPGSEPETGVTIEVVDFGGKAGTIFMVPGTGHSLTPVVWLAEEPGSDRREGRTL